MDERETSDASQRIAQWQRHSSIREMRLPNKVSKVQLKPPTCEKDWPKSYLKPQERLFRKRKKPARIFYSIMFNDEFMLLDIMISEIYDHVEAIVLVELPITHNFKLKKYYFDENRSNYSAYTKIRHVKVSLEECLEFVQLERMLVSGGATLLHNKNWALETYHRYVGLKAVKSELEDEDYYIYTDADEIYSSNFLNFLKYCDNGWDIIVPQLDFYNFRFSCLDQSKWSHPSIQRGSRVHLLFGDVWNKSHFFLNNNHPLLQRGGKRKNILKKCPPSIGKFGWHFSSICLGKHYVEKWKLIEGLHGSRNEFSESEVANNAMKCIKPNGPRMNVVEPRQQILPRLIRANFNYLKSINCL